MQQLPFDTKQPFFWHKNSLFCFLHRFLTKSRQNYTEFWAEIDRFYSKPTTRQLSCQLGSMLAPASSKQRTETGWPWVKLSVTAFTISVLLQNTYMITTQYDIIDTTLRFDFFCWWELLWLTHLIWSTKTRAEKDKVWFYAKTGQKSNEESRQKFIIGNLSIIFV